MNKYSYVFVREDLPNIVRTVQTGHACMELGFSMEVPDEQTFLVVLSVKDENELFMVSKRLEKTGIYFKIFYEPDFAYGYTALCTEPVEYGKHKIFAKYDLLQ